MLCLYNCNFNSVRKREPTPRQFVLDNNWKDAGALLPKQSSRNQKKKLSSKQTAVTVDVAQNSKTRNSSTSPVVQQLSDPQSSDIQASSSSLPGIKHAKQTGMSSKKTSSGSAGRKTSATSALSGSNKRTLEHNAGSQSGSIDVESTSIHPNSTSVSVAASGASDVRKTGTSKKLLHREVAESGSLSAKVKSSNRKTAYSATDEVDGGINFSGPKQPGNSDGHGNAVSRKSSTAKTIPAAARSSQSVATPVSEAASSSGGSATGATGNSDGHGNAVSRKSSMAKTIPAAARSRQSVAIPVSEVASSSGGSATGATGSNVLTSGKTLTNRLKHVSVNSYSVSQSGARQTAANSQASHEVPSVSDAVTNTSAVGTDGGTSGMTVVTKRLTRTRSSSHSNPTLASDQVSVAVPSRRRRMLPSSSSKQMARNQASDLTLATSVGVMTSAMRSTRNRSAVPFTAHSVGLAVAAVGSDAASAATSTHLPVR